MFIKLIRLGRDAESFTTQQGKNVLNFAGAYKVGYGQNEKTQWIDCALWGDRGQAVHQHMKKGTQIVVYGDDLHIEELTKGDGTQGHKLKCRVSSFDFAGGPPQQQAVPQQATAPQQSYRAPAPQAAPQGYQSPTPAPTPTGGGFDDFDDDIPF